MKNKYLFHTNSTDNALQLDRNEISEAIEKPWVDIYLGSSPLIHLISKLLDLESFLLKHLKWKNQNSSTYISTFPN